MTKYFINRKSGSDKFWCAAIKNKTLQVWFGRTGTAGRKLKKQFATKADCAAEWNKLIKEKLAKGYTENKEIPFLPTKPAGSFSPINKNSFWMLINSSLQYTSLESQSKYLKKELKKLSKKDLAAFENIFTRLENACYTWNLWAAAYVIHAGCSDDSFTDFRAWLVTRGKQVYERALKSSDSLSDLSRKKLEQSREGDFFLYLAGTVYENVYGNYINDDSYLKPFKAKTMPSGHEWKEGDVAALAMINPHLFKLFKNK